MKVGIISFAHMHAHSYALQLNHHPAATLSAIWHTDEEQGKDIASRYNTAFYSDLVNFLQSDLDAVIVCSENAKHKDHVLAAARAGKHILCEKPISTTLLDAKQMIKVCQEEEVILQMAYPVRFSPPVQRLKELVQSGAVGEVVAINATNHGQMPGGWFVEKELSGGGAATDHIVHVMDVIRWIFEDEVKSVHAELDTRFYDIDVEDCGMVTLEMESGMVVSIDPSWSRPKTFPTWGDVTMEVIGSKGNISVDAFKQHSLLYNDKEGQVEHIPWGEDMDKGLIEDFIRCVQQKETPSITGEDGLRTLEVVQAAYQSHREEKVVSLVREL